MRELNVAETAEVSGGCCLLLGGLILGALSGFGSSCGGGSFSWGSNCGGFSWGGNWGGNCGGGSYVPAPPKGCGGPGYVPAPSNNCGYSTAGWGGNGGWIGGSFSSVLNNIIHSC